MTSTIAVGIDGSEPSRVALRWALQAAVARRAQVNAVIATPAVDRRATGIRLPSQRQSPARDALSRARDIVGSSAGGAGVVVQEVAGSPADVLLDVSGRVDLLVIGAQQYHRWRHALARSVAERLAISTRTALCVAGTIPEPSRGRIVVGHDGVSSRQAVRFAFAEAGLRGWTVHLVSTWHYPSDTRPTSADPAGLLAEGAAAAQQQVIREIGADFPTVHADTSVVLGHPVDVLTELAGAADMVVVGSHGRGGLKSMLVGSVAVGLLHRLATPVVIVPPGTAAGPR